MKFLFTVCHEKLENDLLRFNVGKKRTARLRALAANGLEHDPTSRVPAIEYARLADQVTRLEAQIVALTNAVMAGAPIVTSNQQTIPSTGLPNPNQTDPSSYDLGIEHMSQFLD